MKLPKLYSPITIKFWSLRNGIGENMGVIFDCDEEVERTVVRVRTADGWMWQIKDLIKITEWDYYAAQDQEILNEYGGDLVMESKK